MEGRASPSACDPGKMTGPGGALIATILFIPLSAAQFNLEADWAEVACRSSCAIARFALQDSIVGHGRRREQAHDQHHNWIGIRRGLCSRCGKTFTFLPPFSSPRPLQLPSPAARRRPRLPGRPSLGRRGSPRQRPRSRGRSSPLRRWCRTLDSSRPPFSFLRETIPGFHRRVARQNRVLVHDSLPLRWHTIFPFLARFWPRGLERSRRPTIRLGRGLLSAYTSTPEAKTAPWPRIWSGSNSASRCWSICSATTGSLVVPAHARVCRAVSLTSGNAPSFYVNAAKNLFYCHGCGRGGT